MKPRPSRAIIGGEFPETVETVQWAYVAHGCLIFRKRGPYDGRTDYVPLTSLDSFVIIQETGDRDPMEKAL